jgi:hypothetical protein
VVQEFLPNPDIGPFTKEDGDVVAPQLESKALSCHS